MHVGKGKGCIWCIVGRKRMKYVPLTFPPCISLGDQRYGLLTSQSFSKRDKVYMGLKFKQGIIFYCFYVIMMDKTPDTDLSEYLITVQQQWWPARLCHGFWTYKILFIFINYYTWLRIKRIQNETESEIKTYVCRDFLYLVVIECMHELIYDSACLKPHNYHAVITTGWYSPECSLLGNPRPTNIVTGANSLLLFN